MEFIPYLIAVLFAATFAVMFNLYNRVQELEEAIENLKSKNLIYEGVLDPPKGKKVEDWEPRVQTLFKSTLHGDDVDRPIKKSDGAWTYFAPEGCRPCFVFQSPRSPKLALL